MRTYRLLPGVLQRPERRGGRRGAAGQAPASAAGRDRLRQRPDGDRRGQGAGPGRRPGTAGRGRGRLRRHLSRQPVRPAADHRAPAHAHAGRAGLRPAARADRHPGAAPRHRATAHRTGAAVQLRLPAGHRHPPAGADTQGPAFGTHQRDTANTEPPARSPPGPASSEGIGAAMPFILRRLVFYLVAAWVALTINFFIPRAMPGNAVQSVMAKFPNLQPSAYKALQALLGVGNPGSIWSQYVAYLNDIFHFNFGTDVSQYPAQVSSLLIQTLPWTITLVGTATVIAFLIGTALGIAAGWRHGGTLDRVLPGLMFLQAIPYFFFALILVEVLAINTHVFPTGQGYDNGLIPGWHWDFISSALYHSLLPALTIVLTSIAGWMLQMRNVMITTSGEDYVVAAQAKGLPSRRVVFTYAARNALLPQLQGFGLAVGFVISGALVMEIVFSYPGIGLLLLNAVTSNDYPLMQAIFLVITFAVLPISAEPAAIPQEEARRGRWRRMPTKAKVGAILLGLFVLAGVIGPLVAPYDPSFQNPSPSLS